MFCPCPNGSFKRTCNTTVKGPTKTSKQLNILGYLSFWVVSQCIKLIKASHSSKLSTWTHWRLVLKKNLQQIRMDRNNGRSRMVFLVGIHLSTWISKNQNSLDPFGEFFLWNIKSKNLRLVLKKNLQQIRMDRNNGRSRMVFLVGIHLSTWVSKNQNSLDPFGDFFVKYQI